MTTNYQFKLKDFFLESIPNDVKISIEGYLSGNDGLPFLTAENRLDTFTVVTEKTSLPSFLATRVNQYLRIQTNGAINTKYGVTLDGELKSGSPIVTNLSATTGLRTGLEVRGEGIPQRTRISSVRNDNSVRLNNNASQSITTSLNFGTSDWRIDYDAIDFITTVIDFTNI